MGISDFNDAREPRRVLLDITLAAVKGGKNG